MNDAETVKIMPSHESQGEFVIINKADFREGEHVEYSEKAKSEDDDAADDAGKPSEGMTKKQLAEALKAKGTAVPSGANRAALADIFNAQPNMTTVQEGADDGQRKPRPSDGMEDGEIANELLGKGVVPPPNATTEDIAKLYDENFPFAAE